MAQPTSIIAVDLGAHSLKLGIFRPYGQGLIIDGCSSVALGTEHSTEEERNASITKALRELLTGRNLKGAEICYTVSGHSVFMRFVKLPRSAPEEIEKMVGFEAKQNVPFPIEVVVWDYQLLQSSGGDELEAIIVAIKGDVLDRLNESVTSSVNTPARVDVAPLALYNAVRFNYGDFDGCTLVLDIGAKTTQLIFIEPGKLFIRGVPIAGNQITQNIAADLQVSVEEAELLKVQKGSVGLGGAYEDPADEETARISKVVRNVMTRLHAEINRSITSYRNQQGGTNPTRILISGGSAVLPYMDIFLREKLHVTVEFFNPLRNVVVGPTADTDALTSTAHRLGETVGMALRCTGPCPVEVELKPAVAAADLEASKRTTWAIAALVVWVIFWGVLWFSANRESTLLQAVLDQREKEYKDLSAENSQVQEQYKAFAFNVSSAEQARVVALERNYWPSLLGELNTIIPNGVWITSLRMANGTTPIDLLPRVSLVTPVAPKPGSKEAKAAAVDTTAGTHLLIEGLYEAYDNELLKNPAQGIQGEGAVKKFLENISKSPYFDVTLKDLEDRDFVTVSVRSSSETRLALNFKIIAKLKQPLPLLPAIAETPKK